MLGQGDGGCATSGPVTDTGPLVWGRGSGRALIHTHRALVLAVRLQLFRAIDVMLTASQTVRTAGCAGPVCGHAGGDHT
jgi:hypothetical protein